MSSAPRAAGLVRGYEVVIGIETHAQLSTRSKIFSGASTEFGAAPNTQASAVDLALPGYDLVTGLGSPNTYNLARNLLDVQKGVARR